MSFENRPVRSIVRAVADAAERWTDGDFPLRVRALERVCARAGYSAPAVEYAFDRLFSSLRAAELEETIARELGSLDALDGFVKRAGGQRERALPVGRVCIISSRTTVGVAVVPAVFALVAKCDVLVKDREDALVSSFFATLGEELDELRDACRATSWSGEDDARDLNDFDVVVAFGEDPTLAAIARRLSWQTRFIGYGAKASAGYVTGDALAAERRADDVAAGAARDLVLYETEGCLSLHVLFVETGAKILPDAFAERLARAVRRAGVEFPLPQRDPSTIARVAAARDTAGFRATQGESIVHSDPEASFVVQTGSPERPPSFLPRVLSVIAVDAPAEAAAYLRRHGIPIEALACDADRDDVVAMAVAAGAARIARFGELQAPRAQSRHGGRPRIAEFVRWVSDERSAR